MNILEKIDSYLNEEETTPYIFMRSLLPHANKKIEIHSDETVEPEDDDSFPEHINPIYVVKSISVSNDKIIFNCVEDAKSSVKIQTLLTAIKKLDPKRKVNILAKASYDLLEVITNSDGKGLTFDVEGNKIIFYAKQIEE